jgi:ABC-type multidrug transport system fused ATPase/permease subunit
MAPGIHAREVSVTLRGRAVLRGASCTVPAGAVTALVAPSGTGKSTLLRACVRLVEADAGTVTLDGVDVRDIEARALRRRVGLVAQTPAMLAGTVADNLRHGVPDLTPAALEAALASADLAASFAVREASALSGGERARVALARALTRSPQVLLLDEPTAALDGASAERIGATLRRLAAGGLAICVATHDLTFARRWTDRQEALG